MRKTAAEIGGIYNIKGCIVLSASGKLSPYEEKQNSPAWRHIHLKQIRAVCFGWIQRRLQLCVEPTPSLVPRSPFWQCGCVIRKGQHFLKLGEIAATGMYGLVEGRRSQADKRSNRNSPVYSMAIFRLKASWIAYSIRNVSSSLFVQLYLSGFQDFGQNSCFH